MDRITRLIPRPRTVAVAGRNFPAWEFRLDDLADLQAWLDGLWADPLDEIWPALNDPATGPGERDRLLYGAHPRAEQGPAAYGSPEGRDLFCTDAGLGVFLYVALRRGTPSLTAGAVASLALDATAEQVAKLRRVCFGVEPVREIERLMMAPPPDQGRSGTTWGEAVDEVARSHHWTYETIYNLTLSEFRNARRHGKPEDAGGVEVPWDQLETYRRAQYERYYGKAPDWDRDSGTAGPEGDGWVYPSKPAE